MGEGYLNCCRVGYEVVGETVTETLCGGGEPVLGLRLTTPKMRTLGAPVDYLKFNAWYRDERARLHNFAAEELYPAAAAEAEERGEGFTERSITSDFEAKLVSCKLCSILLRAEWDVGSGGCELSAQTWLTLSGRILTLAELFRPGCRTGELIGSQIRAAGYEPEDFPERNFYLTQSALTVFSACCPQPAEVEIPLEKLRYCLKPELFADGRSPCDDGCIGAEGEALPPIYLPPLCR